jgi:hypothetical protein
LLSRMDKGLLEHLSRVVRVDAHVCCSYTRPMRLIYKAYVKPAGVNGFIVETRPEVRDHG